MKRFFAAVIAAIMITAAFAGTVIATDPVRINVYNENDAIPDFQHMAWCNTDTIQSRSRGMVFHTAVDFVGLGIPMQWNSNGENAPKVTYDFELFAFDTDYDTSVAGTPVFKQTVTPDGDLGIQGINADTGIYFDFGKTITKGKYAARFKITSESGYSVFPKYSCAYPTDVISFSPADPIAFYLMFANEANAYFIDGKGKPVKANNFVSNPSSALDDKIGVWIDAKQPEVYVKFTTDGNFDGIILNYWASNYKGVVPNGPEADWKIELFEFDKNIEKTVEGTPVHTENMHSIGDEKPSCNFRFDEQEAGTYVIKITITNPDDEMEINGEIKNPYVVLPWLEDGNYDEDMFDYDGGSAFKFTIFGEDLGEDFFIDNPDEDYSSDDITSETESESVAETETETETETDTGSDSESVSESETVTEPESNKEEGSVTETEEDSKETESPVKVEAKDVNGDGEANNKDVVDLFRYVSKGEAKYDPKYDIDGSNEINNKDVVALFRALSEV